MARLLLVRHAPTPETGVRLTGRLPGVSLGADGEEIARRTAERLSGIRVRGVFTSPIERTAETAAIIAARHGIEPQIEPALTEVDYGDWAGKTLAQLRRRALWRKVVATPSQVTFPGGESMLHMQYRAVAACDDIGRRVANGTAIVVSHADVIKAILSHYLGQPLDLFQRIVVSPASVSIVHLPSEGPPVVVAINSAGPPA